MTEQSDFRWAEELGALLRSLREEELRDVVNRFLQAQRLRSDIIHGSSEHGKDIVAIVPGALDVLGTTQVLLVQIKTGDISEARWRTEAKPQFSDAMDHFVHHHEVDEKWPKRYILVFNGKLTAEAQRSVHDYNSRNPVPVEVVDLDRIVSLMVEAGFHKKLLPPSDVHLSEPDLGNCQAILGYLTGAVTSTEKPGLSVSELKEGLGWLTPEQISEALDTLLETGLLVPVGVAKPTEACEGVTKQTYTRRYRPGEILRKGVNIALDPAGAFTAAHIEQYFEGVGEFLKAAVKDNCDYVVAIARKGARLLHQVLKQNDMPATALIPLPVLGHVPGTEFQGKKVLLFDDTVSTGTRIVETARRLQELGARVTPCALLLSADEPTLLDARQGVFWKILHRDEYAEEEAAIALSLAALCPPFEPGRTVIQMDTENFDLHACYGWLQSAGILFALPSTARVFGRRLLTVSNPTFFSSKNVLVPSFVSESAACKIRVYVDVGGCLSIVPIIFPEITHPTPEQVASCKGRREWGMPFCERLPSSWYGGNQPEQCLECSDFHGSVRLGAAFVAFANETITKWGMSIGSWLVDEDQLAIYFRDRTPFALQYVLSILSQGTECCDE